MLAPLASARQRPASLLRARCLVWSRSSPCGRQTSSRPYYSSCTPCAARRLQGHKGKHQPAPQQLASANLPIRCPTAITRADPFARVCLGLLGEYASPVWSPSPFISWPARGRGSLQLHTILAFPSPLLCRCVPSACKGTRTPLGRNLCGLEAPQLLDAHCLSAPSAAFQGQARQSCTC